MRLGVRLGVRVRVRVRWIGVMVMVSGDVVVRIRRVLVVLVEERGKYIFFSLA